MIPTTRSPSRTGIAPIFFSARSATASRTLVPASTLTISRGFPSRMAAMVMG
jgi:hypothetical protein